METDHKRSVRNKFFFIFCYTCLLLLISFVVYLEYRWYFLSHEMPDVVLNFNALTQAY